MNPRKPLAALPKSRLARAGVALAAAALLASCTSAGSSSNQGSPASPAASDSLVTTAGAAKGPVDSFTWNLTAGEPLSVDPTKATYYSDGTVVTNMCDSLLRVNPDFSTTPYLAKYDQASPTKIVFTLIADAKFWDGTPVTAQDVAYSMNRAMSPDSYVSFVYQNVKSIAVTGDKQVTVTFKQPDELFIHEMGAIAGSIVEKAFTEKAGAKFGTASTGVMCSGPFKFGSWKPGDSITLEKNASYWQSDWAAHANTVKFTFITDSTALAQALNSGEVDGAYEISQSTIPNLKASSAGKVYIGPSLQSLGLSVARPDGPLKDVNLRKAIFLTIDRSGLVSKVYNGAATPNYTYMTTNMFQAEAKDIYEAAYAPYEKDRQVNIDAATKLVTASGYSGTPIKLAYTAGDQTQSVSAQLIQESAKKAGLTITLAPLQALQFSDAQTNPDTRSKLGIDLLLSSSFNGTQDPLEPLGFSYLPGAVYNYDNYSDPQVTALFAQAIATFDAKERAALFAKMQDIYEPSFSQVSLLNTDTVTFLNNRLAGATTSFAYWSEPSMAVIGSAS